MTSEDKAMDEMSEVGATPDVSALTAELRRSVTTYGAGTRANNTEATRFCRWAGQSPDGRKWDALMPQGRPAFPWDGASDTRIPLADEVVNGQVDLETTAFWRAQMKVSPVAGGDLEEAATASALMDWVITSRLFCDLTREVELVSQYKGTFGWAAIHVTWQQEQGQKTQTVTIQQLQALAAQAPQGSILADLPALAANPDGADQLAEMLVSVFPHLKKKRALKAVTELRNTGTCDFPVPVQTKNSPSMVALTPWDEFVIPPETTDIQSARVVFRRCYMTEFEIRQHILTCDWDEEWAEEAIATAGKFSNYADWSISAGLSRNALQDKTHLVEIVYGYQKALDQDGLPGVFCTVFCPSVGDKYGSFGCVDYTHGEYPFVVWRTEAIHRKITESRSIPEICVTWQNELKVQRDSIQDYTSISTIPPLQVPKNRGGTIKLGPAVQIGVMRPGEISWMQPPAREPGVAFQLMDRIELQTDRYFGRPNELIPPSISQTRQQRIVTNWLHGWTAAFRQVLALCLQYLSPEEIAKITGQNGPVPTDAQAMDISLRFDVRELSTDLVSEKLKAISTLVLPLDTAGVIDHSKLIEMLMRAIDPAMARDLVTDKGVASQKMFDETNADIGLVALGNPPKLRESDPAAQMRLQFAQQIISSNPKYQQQLQSDPIFAAGMKKMAENLQFSVQQQQNAQTGRLGVPPNATGQM